MRRIAAATPIALVIAACVVGDVEYEGKHCTDTCPDGLACVAGLCSRSGADAAAAAVADSGSVSHVWITDLHVDWATPNAIRWGWTLQGNGPELESYEIAITSESSRAPGVKVWTASDSAELGGYQIKLSSGFDIVDGSITYDLDPQTSYTTVVTVHDTSGHTFVSSPVRGATDAPRISRLDLFAGALPPSAFLLPAAGFAVAPTSGVAGGPSLAYVLASDPDGRQGLFQNLRMSGFDLGVDASLTAKLFATAFLELWIRGSGTPTSSWSELWLRLRDSGGNECGPDACIWSYPGKWLYHPDAANPVYRRVQIPLSAFKGRTTAAPLQIQDLARHFSEVNVGCSYLATTDTTDIDRIAIVW